ncbi:MAG TPA: DUF1360 domain-containing protein [Thermoanaerobaculia bacterium]|jgi:hypothetical protein|nr:DUF1360 domain-containing protein [Thermoanaerobaculia bacterium]
MHDGSPWLYLTLCVLATWRVAHLVAHEDGPFDAIVLLRARAGHGMLGRLMDCSYCLSLWIAAPAALLLARRFPEWCVAWLAISGGSTLLEKLSAPAAAMNLPLEGAHQDVLLRTETRLDDDPERPPTRDAAPRSLAPGA